MTTLRMFDAEAEKILAKYEVKQAAVLPLLYLAQDKTGLVTPEAEAWVAELTGVPIVHVKEVVTFYTLFRKKPEGRHPIKFCTGTSCMLGQGEQVLDYLKKKLGLSAGETSQEGKYSLDEVECLCACEIAPMMQVGEKYYGPLNEEKVDEILDEHK